jgi:hypothetical protein
MTTLFIEHPVTEYESWRAAFDGFADVRRQAGVTNERISRPVDDARYIVLTLDFPSVEQAVAFRQFLETKIWSSPANAPALAGRPRTAIF